MQNQVCNYAVIGHSHAVCLLDAVTDWRTIAGIQTATKEDSRYSQSFQGWFSGMFPDELLQVNYLDSNALKGNILVRVFTGGSKINPAVELRNTEENTQLTVQNEYAELIRSLPDRLPIISFIYGNDHAAMMLGHLPPYDFHEPEFKITCENPDVVPIDNIYVNSIVNEWVGKQVRSLLAIKSLSPTKVFHVLPPPPREKPQNSQYMETLEEAIKKYGFAPDYLRLKWYTRYSRLLSERLKSIDCDVLYPPIEALTEEGFLKQEFAEGLTHANAQYGKLLARDISERLRETV